MGNVIAANITRTPVENGSNWGSVAAPSSVWAFEGLESSLDGLIAVDNTGGSNAVVWDAGGFARVTYNVAGTTGLRYTVPSGKFETLVSFQIRRHTNSCSKMIKTVSSNALIPVSPFANYTIGPTAGGYSGSNLSVSYGEYGGDSGNQFWVDGNIAGGASPLARGAPTQTVVTPGGVAMSIDGSAWDTVEIWARFNSTSTQDGEWAIRLNGVVIFHWQNVWNCSEPSVDEARNRAYIGLAEYTSSVGFYEDYRNFKIGYTRPGWLT